MTHDAQEAEMSVLGSVLLNDKVLDDLRAMLKPGDFRHPPHEAIFNAMVALHEAGSGIDPMLVAETLKTQRKLDMAGGPEYLGTLFDYVPAAANCLHYARLVKSASDLRAFNLMAREAVEAGGKPDADVEVLAAWLSDSILVLLEHTATTAVSLGDSLAEFRLRIEESATGDTPLTVDTGFEDVDRLTGGMPNGRLIVLASRPGVGKTSLAGNIALKVAERQMPVLMFPLEMEPWELAGNMQAIDGSITLYQAHKRRLLPVELERIGRRAADMAHLPIYFWPSRRVSPADVGIQVRREQRRHRVGLVVVDYLQLLDLPRAEKFYLAVGEATKRLKQIAGECRVPILLLCQLNRQPEQREDHRPRLSDLRDSGKIEEDADQVWLLHRPCMGAMTSEQQGQREKQGLHHHEDDYARVYVPKNRTGPTGEVMLGWDGKHMAFSDGESDARQE